MNHDIIILGGGASGLFLAILLKKLNLDVAIVERNERVGVKILSTGNGRCNISNKNISPLNFHSENEEFITELINRYPVELVIDVFESLGLHLIELEEGKLFPLSLQASSVLDIFRINLDELKIPVYANEKITYIEKANDTYILKSDTSKIFKCNKLVLSCGGKSMPKTGSDGIGYRLAKSLNHTIVKTYPALSQLKLKSNILKALSGVRFDGIVSLIFNNKNISSYEGEILYTDYGISGVPVLQLSGEAAKLIELNKKVSISVNHFPKMDKEALIAFLDYHFNMFKNRTIYNCLIGIINKKLIPIFIKSSGISNVNTLVCDLTYEEKKSIALLINSFVFEVIDSTGFGNSQVTLGGVNTLEIDNLTLESKLNKNLYFTGEIMDVTGDCGGYNLYFAWISALCVRDSLIEAGS